MRVSVSVCGCVCVCVCVGGGVCARARAREVVVCDQEANLEICRILLIFWFKIKPTDVKCFV